MMGCNEAIDTACLPDERPYHEVTLSSFDIDRLEVSRGAYLECVTSGACVKPIGGDVFLGGEPLLPVVGLERESAEQYCAWAGKRLPTEAEWEKAARGTDGRIYPWGNEPPDCTRANVVGCGDQIEIGGLHPSGASPYGALDMSGNVSELVIDAYDTDYYAVSPATDPQNVLGASVVRRGCNGHDVVCSPRVSHRGEERSSEDYFVRGTRCARSVD
jgi:formylglycine-generating enzyme required for sulfatase activity